MEIYVLGKIPLEAFRVFDAACRYMNFSKAGRSLNITQAAVSRRIKGLEDQLGTTLYTRRGRNLALTPQGEHLFRRVRATLEYLEESLEPFRDDGVRTISISASGSVSHLWLGEKLRAFGQEHPSVSVRLTTTDTPSELAAESNDLVILYSTGEHPRWNLSLLMPEQLVPVASPAYLERKGLVTADLTADDIAMLDLIDYERFNAHWISFRQWFARLATPPRVRQKAPHVSFSTYVMAIDAALNGDGVALGSTGLIHRYLQNGQLVMLGKERVETGFGYYLGTPKFRTPSDEAIALHTLLLPAKTERPENFTPVGQ
jgi:LysR family transcriptional regulator, glycine cleavage system transcriptional activator